MTYQTPDYEYVKLNVSDMFASYGCPPDEGEASNMNDKCEYSTFVDMGLAHMCYSTLNP